MLRVEMYGSCECCIPLRMDTSFRKRVQDLSSHLEGLGQVEHVPCGHVGPQQLLQEEVREHMAVLVPIVFLQGLQHYNGA